MMKLIALGFLALLAACNTARAQSAFGNNPTLGTSPTQVFPQSNVRRRVIFHNPHASATIACCPATTRGGTAITCAVGGAGSVTLLPRDIFILDGAGSQPGVPMAWNCVSDTASTPFTTFEFE